jgi:hypothetical protein
LIRHRQENAFAARLRTHTHQAAKPVNDSGAIGTQIVFCGLINTALLILRVVMVFRAPVAMVIHDLTDTNVREGESSPRRLETLPRFDSKLCAMAARFNCIQSRQETFHLRHCWHKVPFIRLDISPSGH